MVDWSGPKSTAKITACIRSHTRDLFGEGGIRRCPAVRTRETEKQKVIEHEIEGCDGGDLLKGMTVTFGG